MTKSNYMNEREIIEQTCRALAGDPTYTGPINSWFLEVHVVRLWRLIGDQLHQTVTLAEFKRIKAAYLRYHAGCLIDAGTIKGYEHLPWDRTALAMLEEADLIDAWPDTGQIHQPASLEALGFVLPSELMERFLQRRLIFLRLLTGRPWVFFPRVYL